jgi:hypothetical protein
LDTEIKNKDILNKARMKAFTNNVEMRTKGMFARLIGSLLLLLKV